MPSLAGSESSLVISAGWSGDESLSFAFPLLQDQPDAMQVGRQHRQGNRTQREIEDPCTPAFALDPAARRMPMRGVRCGSHAWWHHARNSWRTVAARAWSYLIPCSIRARIASDYGGRLMLHHTGRCAVSLRTATRSTAGASATRAGRSVTVRSERDGRQQSSWRSAAVHSGTRVWVRSNRTALRLDASRGRPGGGRPAWQASAARLARRCRPGRTASRTRSPPRCAPRGADRAPPRETP